MNNNLDLIPTAQPRLEATHRVFVYGTLKAGERNHFLLDPQWTDGAGVTHYTFLLGTAATKDAAFTLLAPEVGGYPYLWHGTSNVRGEVYLVDDATLAQLDDLEGVEPLTNPNGTIVPPLYHRMSLTMQMDNKDFNPVDCWVYFPTQNPQERHHRPLTDFGAEWNGGMGSQRRYANALNNAKAGFASKSPEQKVSA